MYLITNQGVSMENYILEQPNERDCYYESEFKVTIGETSRTFNTYDEALTYLRIIGRR